MLLHRFSIDGMEVDFTKSLHGSLIIKAHETKTYRITEGEDTQKVHKHTLSQHNTSTHTRGKMAKSVEKALMKGELLCVT